MISETTFQPADPLSRVLIVFLDKPVFSATWNLLAFFERRSFFKTSDRIFKRELISSGAIFFVFQMYNFLHKYLNRLFLGLLL